MNTRKGLHAVRITPRIRAVLARSQEGPHTTSQIARLYYHGNRRKAAEALKKLWSAGHINRIVKPFLETTGRPEYLYYAKTKKLPRGLDWIQHALTISEFGVALHRWHQQHKQFTGDFHRGRHLSNGTLRPDATYTITRDPNTQNEKNLLFFLEVDRATTPLTSHHHYNVQSKLATYASYFDDRGYHELGPFNGFRVTILVPDDQRLHQIRQHLLTANFDFVLLAETSQIDPTLFTLPLWTTFTRQHVCLFGPIRGDKPGPPVPTSDVESSTNSTTYEESHSVIKDVYEATQH